MTDPSFRRAVTELYAGRGRPANGDGVFARAETWNDNPKPFTWHKSADDIPQRLAGYLHSKQPNATSSTLTGR